MIMLNSYNHTLSSVNYCTSLKSEPPSSAYIERNKDLLVSLNWTCVNWLLLNEFCRWKLKRRKQFHGFILETSITRLKVHNLFNFVCEIFCVAMFSILNRAVIKKFSTRFEFCDVNVRDFELTKKYF